jgi:hypothetical protein
MVSAHLGLMLIYRLLALVAAGMLVRVIWRAADWRAQVVAALVLLPLALRAAGVK